MDDSVLSDWGEASEAFDRISRFLAGRDVTTVNEAQTRFDVIDRVVKEVLGWRHGQIDVEQANEGERRGFVDYILRSGDYTIVIEAKRVGAAFPSPTRRPKLKLTGSVLGRGDVSRAIAQAEEYARTKRADVVIVTNGLCWCFYSLHDRDDDTYATLLFPFDADGHAEELFNIFSVASVDAGSLERVSNRLPVAEDRLLSAFNFADARVDRNNIADHIMPALNNALYADALLSNVESLDKCFVPTEARTRFDALLGMHLADLKPEIIAPAKRIKTGKGRGHLEQIVATSMPSHAPPVTLIIGPVGVGKSTYLKHFEQISGRDVLDGKRAHWMSIDFEEMGPGGSPRQFIYNKLRDYLLDENDEHVGNPTDYEHAIKPAYRQEIDALKRGPYAALAGNKEEFDRITADHIRKDFDAVEPYVDKVFRYIAQQHLCVIVLDNIDLYEDDALETTVFAEGLAFSKRIRCHVIVSIRDKTFVRHRTDATFDAYELRKLWLDPPNFKAVLSRRLTYSKKILEHKSARVALSNGMYLQVPDLSVFFDIVQRSILQQQAGDYIDSISDSNIRRGLTLVTNFLTSGHINADRAITAYIKENEKYIFPFQEVFKGTMLGQWKHFREDKSEGINVFDARLGSHALRLLRLNMLTYMLNRAQHEHSVEVPVLDCVRLFSGCGASPAHVVDCLRFLHQKGLVRSVTAEDLDQESTIVLTRSGGYYTKILSRKFPYVEECMFDTAIDDAEVWQTLQEATAAIEREFVIPRRMEMRKERISAFLDYLYAIESQAVQSLGDDDDLASMPHIRMAVLADVDDAIRKSWRRHHVAAG